MIGLITWMLVSNAASSQQMEISYSMTCNCSWSGPEVGSALRMETGNLTNLTYRQSKIVGGKRATQYYPMMVGLLWPPHTCSLCGGSVLTHFHVLTAAHCVYDTTPDLMALSFGRMTLCTHADDGGQTIPVKRIVYHPDYNPTNYHYDIAILITTKAIEFDDTVGPVCIYNESVLQKKKEKLLAVGWGKTRETAMESSNWLNTAVLDAIDLEDCYSMLGSSDNYLINPNKSQLCTYTHLKDTCQGDSGSPIFAADSYTNRLVQVGLVSAGVGCARIGSPGVNTALTQFMNWIESVINSTSLENKSNSSEMNFCDSNYNFLIPLFVKQARRPETAFAK